MKVWTEGGMSGKSGRRGAAMMEKERSEQGREEVDEPFVTFRRIRKEAKIRDHPRRKESRSHYDFNPQRTKLLY